jgi:hypothetical protein
MEARSQGEPLDIAVQIGIDQSVHELPEDIAATFAGLLRAYYEVYGPADPWATVHSELQFNYRIPGTSGWATAGKIDNISADQSAAFVKEHKTTGESVAPDSQYWLRLRYNPQLLNYADATTRLLETPVTKALYDLVRKPLLKRKMIPKLDDNGFKVVMNESDGSRAYLKDGVTPRSTGGAGFIVQETQESVEQFSDRIFADVMSRRDYYFARKEVAILSDTLQAFREERLRAIRLIRFLRKQEKTKPDLPRETAWIRSCNGMTCRGCPYTGFCLENRTVDPANPPEGYTIAHHQELNPEPEQEPADV